MLATTTAWFLSDAGYISEGVNFCYQRQRRSGAGCGLLPTGAARPLQHRRVGPLGRRRGTAASLEKRFDKPNVEAQAECISRKNIFI